MGQSRATIWLFNSLMLANQADNFYFNMDVTSCRRPATYRRSWCGVRLTQTLVVDDDDDTRHCLFIWTRPSGCRVSHLHWLTLFHMSELCAGVAFACYIVESFPDHRFWNTDAHTARDHTSTQRAIDGDEDEFDAISGCPSLWSRSYCGRTENYLFKKNHWVGFFCNVLVHQRKSQFN